MATNNIRFDLLDGIRGLAAISVMLYHFTQHNELHWLRGAWVAVDLFFILSGFVIAHSYGEKLRAGMPFADFFATRFIRLAPLYYVGLLLGFAASPLLISTGELQVTPIELGTATALGFFWLPYLNFHTWTFAGDSIVGPTFPLNNPAWSLFFEVFANLTLFVWIKRKKSPPGPLAISLFALTYAIAIFGLHHVNPGWGTNSFIYGFPRVLLGFFAGTLIYEKQLHLKPAKPKLTLLVGALTTLFLFSGGWSVISAITLVPLFVLLAVSIKIESKTMRNICGLLGDISYPLYIIHFPVFSIAWNTTSLQALPTPMQIAVVSTICLLLAAILSTLDKKLRIRLKYRTGNRHHSATKPASG